MNLNDEHMLMVYDEWKKFGKNDLIQLGK